MKVIPKNGIDKLVFGMKQNDVLSIFGNPDKQFKDEDQNVIFIYNDLMLQMSFYEEEDFRLGYLISSNPELTIFDHNVIGKTIENLKSELLTFKTWEKENFDLAENYFNEENWLILVSEFNKIVKVELGCIINDDEFDWKYGE
ncbi:hypothetical protein [Flavobacterium sp.]|uniref:hypothetical protein n=1 Tax=Flavobacterium sp. TaxID=239 RepID=UPI00286C8219|nr:hypothetical protein [Flavobacterium sp.]